MAKFHLIYLSGYYTNSMNSCYVKNKILKKMFWQKKHIRFYFRCLHYLILPIKLTVAILLSDIRPIEARPSSDLVERLSFGFAPKSAIIPDIIVLDIYISYIDTIILPLDVRCTRVVRCWNIPQTFFPQSFLNGPHYLTKIPKCRNIKLYFNFRRSKSSLKFLILLPFMP